MKLIIKINNGLSLSLLVLLIFLSNNVLADEYKPAYLELSQVSETTYKMLWKVPVTANGGQSQISVIFDDNVKFTSATTKTQINGFVIEQTSISKQNGLSGTLLAIKGLQAIPADVLVRIERLDGDTETARLTASNSTFIVKGTPNFWEVVHAYLEFGIDHILQGFDHLLFITCLIFIASTWPRILITITGFTLAHSITLTLAALDIYQLPIGPIEAVIAMSIVFLAREIALDKRDSLTWRYPMVISSSFGLLHGFGFASALSEIGLPQSEIPAALLAFNIGVELGQIMFVAALLLLLNLFHYLIVISRVKSKNSFKQVQTATAWAIGIVGTFWTMERITNFWS